MSGDRLRVAFVHPDLGIGGAERLVVDAALGLQKLGHSVDIYTSHHDPGHCFEETRDGTLSVKHLVPPFPRAIAGKLHILFAHLRQLHLTLKLITRAEDAPHYDVFFVDQLSTCVPLLRRFAGARVVFYCHFPDQLLANGEFVEDPARRKRGSLLKRLYRIPMDRLEEWTTGQADVILANSNFTARVFKSQFRSIHKETRVVHPGINLSAYDAPFDPASPDITAIQSNRPTFVSLNRFEAKKNVDLAIEAFARFRSASRDEWTTSCRLVVAGGYDPRVEDNVATLTALTTLTAQHGLSYAITSPSPSAIPPSAPHPADPDVLFLLNFTLAQRTALLRAPSALGLLYTPANEHFGIIPCEAMYCGLPVLARDTGGPTETVVEGATGWLRPGDAAVWAGVLGEMARMDGAARARMAEAARARVEALFGMEAMARGVEDALREAVAMGELRASSAATWLMVAWMLLGFVLAYTLAPLLQS
ncbi:glycosyltransferase family 4 protein [Schizophyllum fasciatum]